MEELTSLIHTDVLGGAILAYRGSVVLFHGDIYFKLNTAAFSGGAIHTIDTNLTMKGNILFEDNSAYISGGGVYAEGGTVEMTQNVSFIHNKARSGGGMWLETKLTMKGNIVFEDNLANISGGGVYAEGGTVRITGSVNFIHNKAKRGGGMWLEAGAGISCICTVLQQSCRRGWWSNLHIRLRLCV